MDTLFTTNIYIDTSIFINMNFDFNNYLFKRLIQLSEDNHIALFTTEVTKEEVISNIKEMVERARAPLNDIRKEGRILRNINDYSAVFDRKRLEHVYEEIITDYNSFISNVDINFVHIEGISIESMMTLYFNKQAPFSNKKKSEFPDAITLLALEKWCEDNNQEMYIISTDGDLSNYCNSSSRLAYLSSIDEFINLLVSDDEHKHSYVISAFQAHTSLIEESITEEFEDFGFDVYDNEGDVDNIAVTDIDIDYEPYIVALSNSTAILTFEALVRYEAKVSILDYSGSYYDKEEGKYLIKNYNDIEVEDDIMVSFTMEIEYDINDKNSFTVSSIKINNEYLSINVYEDEY